MSQCHMSHYLPFFELKCLRLSDQPTLDESLGKFPALIHLRFSASCWTECNAGELRTLFFFHAMCQCNINY